MKIPWPFKKQCSFRKLRNLLLTSIILIPITAVVITEAEPPKVGKNLPEDVGDTLEKLSFCSDDNQHTINRRLLYVTTLDGKMSALDIANKGKLHWTISTDPGALISSSIHRLELTNNGQWVRMIPSLSGGLYKFDGETLDPIPITAENLLSSSFKFSDDLVVSGGKETQTYGVSVRTGQVLYKCSINGCINETETTSRFGPPRSGEESNLLDEHDPLIDDVLVIRRQTQTVRAVEPRTGTERWNFSVGHHEMEVLKSTDCHDRPFSNVDLAVLDMDIKVIVPKGMIYAFSKQDPETVLWEYKFDHPIVSAWRNDASDSIQTIDLFGAAQWLWNGGAEGVNSETALISPSVYLGMYQKQLYIQESRSLASLVTDETKKISQHLITNESNLPQIPWKPYPVSSSALAVMKTEDDKVIHDDEKSTYALSVLYASEYVNGDGFYLYTQSDLNETQKALCEDDNTTKKPEEEFDFNFEEADTPVKIIVVSLWYWWKEIIVIALTTALIVNLALSPKIRREREFVVIEKHIPVPTANEATEESFTSSRSAKRSISESSGDNFVSRFTTDFDFIQCLGKGGFGVVFEAKNKLDDCNYAVKRIILPNKKESRDRVLREVKTLANCEHQHIVRYFQAWLESPPPGWQEQEDRKWLLSNELQSTSIDIETPDGTTLPPFPNDSNFSNSGILEQRDKKLASWISNLNSVPEDLSNFNEDMMKRSSVALDWNRDESSSFIQFREDSKASNESFSKSPLPNGDDAEDSDSFEIEFQHSKKGESSIADETGNNNDSTTDSYAVSNNKLAKMKNMKRHMSLDLTSQGDVIVPIPDRCPQKVYLYIQMQLCRKQSLKEWMRECKAIERHPRVKNVFEQIVEAVGYVHLKGLIHRDLKPSNIFFSLEGQIKIGDFGLVTDTYETPSPSSVDNAPPFFETRRTQQVGTRLYMSPEQLQGRPYDHKVDIFSLGLIFYELLVDFDTEMERIITLEKLRKGQFPHDFQEKFVAEYNLLRSMLAPAPRDRPSTAEIKTMLVPVGNGSGDALDAQSRSDIVLQLPSNLENVVRSTVKFGIAEND